jgi:hypothetical protein
MARYRMLLTGYAEPSSLTSPPQFAAFATYVKRNVAKVNMALMVDKQSLAARPSLFDRVCKMVDLVLARDKQSTDFHIGRRRFLRNAVDYLGSSRSKWSASARRNALLKV